MDEDAEADAAIAAAMVRQLSAQVMHAANRVRELEQRGDALAFGHTTADDETRWYIGRHSIIEGDDVLLVDWRADAAIPFYRATPGDRLGVSRRRHFHYENGQTGSQPNSNPRPNNNVEPSSNVEPNNDAQPTSDDQRLVDYSDELLSTANLTDDEAMALRGEAALMARLSGPTESHMRSVVATIQAEQDQIIRASSRKPLLVQGGPGTGKTVVALHRAAYLLYNDRTELADTGVLLIGPSKQFLTYVRQVLPSLGETGVVAVTPAELFPGVLRGWDEDKSVAELKGDIRMAHFLRTAVLQRQRLPKAKLEVWYGSTKVTVPTKRLQEIFNQARSARTHNTGAKLFAEQIYDELLSQVYHPSFDNSSDADRSFRQSLSVKEFLLSHWPTLRPEQFLNDLFGSKALLQWAGRHSPLTADEALLLFRDRSGEADLDSRRWSQADVALLDESFSLLIGSVGDEIADTERLEERDAATEFDEARAVDEGVDLADYDEDDSGMHIVADKDLGLSQVSYDDAESEWDAKSEAATGSTTHPKFQARLDAIDNVDYG